MEEVFEPLYPSGFINPTDFTYLFRVGLKSHTLCFNAGHVERGGASDRRRASISRVDRVSAGPPIDQITTCLFKRVIMAQIVLATWLTEERRSGGARTTGSTSSHVL